MSVHNLVYNPLRGYSFSCSCFPCSSCVCCKHCSLLLASCLPLDLVAEYLPWPEVATINRAALSWVMKPTSSGWVDRICSVLDANDLDRLWYLGMRKYTWNENYTTKCKIKKGKRHLHKNITDVVWRSVRMDGQICDSQTKESPVPVNILMFNFISKQGHSL